MKQTVFIIFLLTTLISFAQQSKRKLQPSDVYRLQTISDPQVSPDGKWVSYTLSSIDSSLNKRNADIWMISWDGKDNIQLTSSTDGESQAKWSPDGKYISFVSSRQGTTGSQIWLMNRLGGEAKVLTNFKNELNEYAWAPDGKKILVALKTQSDTTKPKTPKPIYIDRYQFKKDIEGYLTKREPIHLYLFDISTKKLDTLTTGKYDETNPVWSPDGTQIAFVSNRTEDPDKNENQDIFVIDAKRGAVAKQITKWTGYDNNPIWSPDGKSIAYLQSTTPDNYIMYDQPILAIASVAGGDSKLLTQSLNRPVNNIKFSKDGNTIAFIVTDDRTKYVAQVDLKTSKISKLAGGNKAFNNIQSHSVNNWLVMMSESQLPNELYALENGITRRLTTHQDSFIAPLQLASVEGFNSISKDGNKVGNILLRPNGIPSTQKLPTLFYIHGGPVGQDDYGFDMTRQMLAAAGYNVVGVNYRGSNGRGLNYCKTIFADWGNKEVLDILGAADEVVKKGITDSSKLGIFGWSYGGMLTNYSIASDTRFKAASSGAGVSMISSFYGVDQYILQYDYEVGAPWKNIDKYLKLSYPFLKADKIKTPTQFMVGESDFNVPAVGSEQMYQALRSLGIPTELIIYPNQFHGITVPSYLKDRFERYIAWFNKYLK
jgi:dipeptidyl aminopeptidase/acylaminoacyl peptidase